MPCRLCTGTAPWRHLKIGQDVFIVDAWMTLVSCDATTRQWLLKAGTFVSAEDVSAVFSPPTNAAVALPDEDVPLQPLPPAAGPDGGTDGERRPSLRPGGRNGSGPEPRVPGDRWGHDRQVPFDPRSAWGVCVRMCGAIWR